MTNINSNNTIPVSGAKLLAIDSTDNAGVVLVSDLLSPDPSELVVEMECLPTRVFTTVNDIPTNYTAAQKKYSVFSNRLFYDTTGKEIKFSNGLDEYIFTADISEEPSGSASFNSGLNTQTIAHTVVLEGNDGGQLSVSFNEASTKASVGASTKIAVLCLGDSVTAGVNTRFNEVIPGIKSYPEYLQYLFLLDHINNGNSGFDMRTVGTIFNTTRGANPVCTFDYGGSSNTFEAYCEGYASTSLSAIVNQPALFDGGKYGKYLWNVLGLQSQIGVFNAANTAHVYALNTTPYGRYAPDLTDNFARFFLNLTDSDSIDAGQIATAQEMYLDLRDNPTNKFYDYSELVEPTDIPFSLGKYLERMATHDSDFVELVSPGSDALANSFVCRPTHIHIAHGTNGLMSATIDIAALLISKVRAYYASQSAAVFVSLSLNWMSFVYNKELYPNDLYAEELYTSILLSKFLPTINSYRDMEVEANGVFHVPVHLVQPQAIDYPYAVMDDGVTRYHNSNGGSYFHPNATAHFSWAKQLYAYIKYTLTL